MSTTCGKRGSAEKPIWYLCHQSGHTTVSISLNISIGWDEPAPRTLPTRERYYRVIIISHGEVKQQGRQVRRKANLDPQITRRWSQCMLLANVHQFHACQASNHHVRSGLGHGPEFAPRPCGEGLGATETARCRRAAELQMVSHIRSSHPRNILWDSAFRDSSIRQRYRKGA